jgi:hypothetical protein
MKKFLINIILFFLIAIAIGEVVVRSTHTIADLPKRTIDEYGIQKYFPNQNGYYKDSNHKWMINEYGWPGELPERFDNLVMVIGDSYIENFMNPNECHQSVFLKDNLQAYNFMETSRSGVSLIEAMEISKQMDSLKPKHTLVYVNDNDFYDSITEVKRMSDITQLSLKKNEIVFGKMKSPGVKKVLYNFKLLYYFYTRFPLSKSNEEVKEPIKQEKPKENILKSKDEVFKLLKYITNNYNIKDKTLVFHPKSNKELIESCKNLGFNFIALDSSNDKDWTFGYDTHRTCYGHQKVAEQVVKTLSQRLTTAKTNNN